MTELLIWPGPPARSQFRLDKLRAELARRAPEFEFLSLFAQSLHVLQTSEPLTPEQRRIAQSLLTYGPQRDWPSASGSVLCTVAPRLGTISPWSSKASDIFSTASLDCVSRVERCTRWYAAIADERALDAAQHARVCEPLFDRMTERLVSEAELASIFAVQAPAPVRTIPLRAEGIAALQAANQSLGLALSEDEIEYLSAAYARLDRDPTDGRAYDVCASQL